MEKGVLYIFIPFIALLLISCDSNQVSPGLNESYVKIINAERGNTRFEIWSLTSDSLITGYNKIGFKVFENNVPKNSGFVKFFTKMYHLGSNSIHSTPVQAEFHYDQNLDLFPGYIIMLMPSDSTSLWFGFYNYNNDIYLDSVQFDVQLNTKAKFKIFVDLSTSLSYLITLLNPINTQRGNNNFQCMLHESFDFIYFTQINDANMYLKPWLDSLNHISANNINPVHIGNGIYDGKVNFDYSGFWRVYDSIYYNNKWITPFGDPPFFVFQVP